VIAQVLVDDAGPDVGHLRPLGLLGLLVDDESVGLLVVGQAIDRQLLAADMPAAAQATRVYDDYLRALARTHPDDLAVLAISVIGPRNQVAKLVRHLELLP